MRLHTLLAPVFLVLLSCSAGQEDTADPCSHDPTLEWDNFGEPFLAQFCNGCHSSQVPEVHRNGAPGGIDFDTYEKVLTWVDRIEARTLAIDPGNAMPPGGGPTDEERQRVGEWIQCAVIPDREIFMGGS